METLEKAFANENTRKSLRTMVMEGFRLAEEKGCSNDFQKWYAVQMAISSYIKDGCQTTGNYRSSIKNHSDAAVYYAYHHILDYVSEVGNLIDFMKPNIELSCKEEGPLKGNEKIFNVNYQTSNKQITFNVSLEGNVPKGASLDKTQVAGDGTLKVKISKESLVEKGDFKVSFKTKSRVWDVVFLETAYGKQNTVTATNPMIEASNNISLQYEPAHSQIKFLKEDEDTGQVLEGASFQFWNKDPSEYGFENNSLGVFKTDAKGEILVADLLSAITPIVYYKELEAPLGYEIDNEKLVKEVKIEAYNQFYNVVCSNKKKVPKIFKKDLAEALCLPEAEFEIKNEDGSKAFVFKERGLEKEVAPTIISNEKGELVLPTGLKFGTYQLIETKAPKGYLPREEPYTFKWYSSMDLEKNHVITNRKIQLGTFIQKNGEKIVESNDPFFYELNTIRNASNVSLESFTWHDKLPYEYISVEKMKTGTYFEPEGYELFAIVKDKGKIQLENSLKDQDDQLTKGHHGFDL